MASVTPASPFESISGNLSRKERIVLRTRNGRMHAYAIIPHASDKQISKLLR